MSEFFRFNQHKLCFVQTTFICCLYCSLEVLHAVVFSGISRFISFGLKVHGLFPSSTSTVHYSLGSYSSRTVQDVSSGPSSLQGSLASSPSPSASVSTPSNDDIEAIIQMATSSRSSPDGKGGPPRDTRTQLFVGNVRILLS